MAGTDYPEHPYLRQLNDYHAQLMCCVDLAVHLLDLSIEDASEEWRRSAGWLMRDQLKRLAEDLPFPPSGSMIVADQVQSLFSISTLRHSILCGIIIGFCVRFGSTIKLVAGSGIAGSRGSEAGLLRSGFRSSIFVFTAATCRIRCRIARRSSASKRLS